MIPFQVANEAQDFFHELFLGNGAWLGVLIIVAIMLLLNTRVKFSQIITIPLSIVIGAWYLLNLSGNSNFMWCAVISFLSTVVMLLLLLSD